MLHIFEHSPQTRAGAAKAGLHIPDMPSIFHAPGVCYIG
jgi:hypothetical protein